MMKKQVDFDYILVNHLGQFGRYNIKLLCLLFIIITFSEFSRTSYIFTTAQIPSRCYIRECDDNNPEFSPAWILNAVPGTSLGSIEKCTRYLGVSNTTNYETCPATLFEDSTTISCDSGNVYENTNTIVYDFDLGCNEWQRAFVGTIRTVGTFLGIWIWGVCSDRWGRKTVLIILSFISALFGLAKYWATSYTTFTVLEFIEAFFEAGVTPGYYVLFVEQVGPDYREMASASTMGIATIGYVIFSLIAWGIQNWRNLILALYAPQILVFVLYWLIPESTRWLISKKRFDEAETNLKRHAKSNKKTIPESVLLELRKNKESDEANAKNEDEVPEPWLIITVFKEKSLLLRCMIAPIWWITVIFIYYGLQINAVNLAGNPYLNFMAVSAVDFPGFWSSSFLMKWFDRRTVLSGCFFICALCQIGNIFVTDDLYALSLFLYLFGKYLAALAGTAMYIYTAELFPTKYRQSLFSYASMMGRLGAIVAPLTPAFSAIIWTELPFALYAGFALLSAGLIFLTPETKGIDLPDTLDEAIVMNKRQAKESEMPVP